MAGKASPSTTGLASLLAKSDYTALKRLIADAVRDGIKESMAPLNSQVDAIEQKVKKLDSDLLQQGVKMDAMGSEMKKNRQAENALKEQFRLLDKTSCFLIWENSQKKLRLQDLTLPERADLKETVTQLLAPSAGLSEEDLFYQIQAIYCMENHYTRTHALAPEVHITFKDKEVRDTILFSANKKPVELEGKKIRILKDIPLIIRQKRQDFKPLAKQLVDKGIVFKWLNPQGLQFMYRDQLFRLISIKQQEDFLEKYGADFKARRADETTSKTKPKDQTSKEQEKEKGRKDTKKMELRQRKT